MVEIMFIIIDKILMEVGLMKNLVLLLMDQMDLVSRISIQVFL